MVAAITLHAKHRLEAESLAEQVIRVVQEPARVTSRLIDKRELRGWPAAGKGICGAIRDTIPGWNLFDDE
jgi:2-polyprenyl-3-methyl-5-hydroxy-6-metoxy-1,4-benzoquinol methylase